RRTTAPGRGGERSFRDSRRNCLLEQRLRSAADAHDPVLNLGRRLLVEAPPRSLLRRRLSLVALLLEVAGEAGLEQPGVSLPLLRGLDRVEAGGRPGRAGLLVLPPDQAVLVELLLAAPRLAGVVPPLAPPESPGVRVDTRERAGELDRATAADLPDEAVDVGAVEYWRRPTQNDLPALRASQRLATRPLRSSCSRRPRSRPT